MNEPESGSAAEKNDSKDGIMNEPTAAPADADTEQTEDRASDEPAEDATEEADQPKAGKTKRRVDWSRVLAFGVLPALALILAMAAGFLKWQEASVRVAETARIESVQAAKDSTIALLAYKPDTVEQQLGAAQDLLTGEFRDSYASLINDVVIPGAKEKQISAVATIPAAASVSADTDHAVVLVFVNQTTIIGDDAPTDTASGVRVTLDKVDGRWLISQFEPV